MELFLFWREKKCSGFIQCDFFYSSFPFFFVAKWQPVFIAKVAGVDDVWDKTGVGFWDKMICKVPECLVNKGARREVAAGCACRAALFSRRCG